MNLEDASVRFNKINFLNIHPKPNPSTFLALIVLVKRWICRSSSLIFASS